MVLEEEILRRVAGDRQLGEDDELGAGLFRALDPGGDLPLVSGDVADGRVHLAEREAERRVGLHPPDYEPIRGLAPERSGDRRGARSRGWIR